MAVDHYRSRPDRSYPDIRVVTGLGGLVDPWAARHRPGLTTARAGLDRSRWALGS